MLDFSSALYLAWRHPAHSLGDWPSLSLGKPAALEPVPGSVALARQLAQLQACAAASICSSSLHLFWDLFPALCLPNSVILLDDACYPVLEWGVERLAAQGIPVLRFAAHDWRQVAQLVTRCQQQQLRPMIVSEGYAPSLSRAAPLRAYADLALAADGLLVIDDTQALGMFGTPANTCPNMRPASAATPWGLGGGGSLQAQQVFGPHIVVGASLAKAFGAPLAVLAGSSAIVQRFEACSQTRLHASPPSVAAVRAAQLALHYNQHTGDARRAHLWQLLQHWWRGLLRLGLQSHGGPFPVQTLVARQADLDWCSLHRYLQSEGIRAVLQQVQAVRRWQLSFIFHAEHSLQQIDQVLHCIAHWLRRQAGSIQHARQAWQGQHTWPNGLPRTTKSKLKEAI